MPLFGALCPDRMLGRVGYCYQARQDGAEGADDADCANKRDKARAIDPIRRLRLWAMTKADRWQDTWPRWKDERIDAREERANRFVPLPRQRHTTMGNGLCSSDLADAGLRAEWYSGTLHCWLARYCCCSQASVHRCDRHTARREKAGGGSKGISGSSGRLAALGNVEAKSSVRRRDHGPVHASSLANISYIRQLANTHQSEAYPHFDQQTGADGAESCHRAAHKPNPGMDFTGVPPNPKL